MFFKFMKGYRLKYIFASISIIISSFLSVIIPIIIKTSIDSIIGDKKIEGRIILSFFNLLGGRDYLREHLYIVALLIVLITALNGLFMYIKGKWANEAAEATAKNLRDSLYSHLQRIYYNFHVEAKTGDLIQRCTSDVETIKSFLAVQFVEIGRTVFMVLFILSIMFYYNAAYALISISLIPFIFAASYIFFKKVKKQFQLCDEAEGEMSAVLQENLTGVRVVKAFNREEFEIEKFEEKNRTYRDLLLKLMRTFAYFWSSSDAMCMLQTFLVVVYGVYLASKGAITLGTLIIFISYIGMLLWPIRQLGRILSDMGKSFVAIARINEILKEPIEDLSTGLTPNIEGNIEFKNLYFSYRDGKDVLKDITFSIKKGETIAIIGPTGSGKSTLAYLLLGLYDYNRGSIELDGVELKNINKNYLRQNIGLVSQDCFLFSKTLKENIAISTKNVEDERIFEASKIADIHDTILSFEKGYETQIGEKGVTLSGGQKQRVAIARCVIKDYRVLIFDDSLSAVDTETEQHIRNRLKERSKDTTTIIITHRLTTAHECDRIIVLDKGTIIEMGSHDELIKKGGFYRRLWDIQSQLDEE
ncbi:ABC transporter ATP-binding protein [Caloramator proteoclasticus]|uniref:ATP-binding cassette, subfamily B n=1 Tax=Caloramator proteoclasticus DSM 10124 TaxID=1121262 RepID=A0A1M4YVE7_9CLOT|nr:ABC transporter ATP-binding protein [Caloramator proteoclasticus]SHF09753.1 ATP-binding cassette, subfamily B [Caloramator proteoclasticus DSM 10124]